MKNIINILSIISFISLAGIFLLSIYMAVHSAGDLVKKTFKEQNQWISVKVEEQGEETVKIFPSQEHYEAYKTVKFMEKKLDKDHPEVKKHLNWLYLQTQNPEVSSNSLFSGLNLFFIELEKLENKKDP